MTTTVPAEYAGALRGHRPFSPTHEAKPSRLPRLPFWRLRAAETLTLAGNEGRIQLVLRNSSDQTHRKNPRPQRFANCMALRAPTEASGGRSRARKPASGGCGAGPPPPPPAAASAARSDRHDPRHDAERRDPSEPSELTEADNDHDALVCIRQAQPADREARSYQASLSGLASALRCRCAGQGLLARARKICD